MTLNCIGNVQRGEGESEERKQQSKTIALDNAPHAGCLYAFFLMTIAHRAARIIESK